MSSQFHRSFRTVGRYSTPTTPQGAWLAEFQRRLLLALHGRVAAALLEDVVSNEIDKVAPVLAEKMEQYPEAFVYALERAKSHRALNDYLRRENGQAGRGTMYQAIGGELLAGRRVEAGDLPHHNRHEGPGGARPGRGTGTNYDAAAAAAESCDFTEAYVERDVTRRMLQQALMALPADQREVLLLVDGQGYTVTAAAAMLGMARETAARKRSAAKRTLRRLLNP